MKLQQIRSNISNDYELLEKLHCLVQEVEAELFQSNHVVAEMYEIIEHLREKNPQAPWNNEIQVRKTTK